MTEDPSITRHEPAACPICGHTLDAAGTTDGAAGRPEPGDVTACLRCGHPMVFTDKLRLRSMSEAEWAALPDECQVELTRVRTFADAMKRQVH